MLPGYSVNIFHRDYFTLIFFHIVFIDIGNNKFSTHINFYVQELWSKNNE